MRRLILIALFLSGELAIAQDFRPGYVILNNKDSIPGFVDYKFGKANEKICRFRETRKSRTREYYPADIAAYAFLEIPRENVLQTHEANSMLYVFDPSFTWEYKKNP